MPGNPKFYPFHQVNVMPKGGKSTDRDYNLIFPEDSQDAKFQAIPSMRSLGNTDGPTDPSAGGERVFRASDGRTDNMKT